VCVGDAVGDIVGEREGDTVVGDTVGDAVGDIVGERDGDTVGEVVGDTVGDAVGDFEYSWHCELISAQHRSVPLVKHALSHEHSCGKKDTACCWGRAGTKMMGPTAPV
jgi:hypothetical protein